MFNEKLSDVKSDENDENAGNKYRLYHHRITMYAALSMVTSLDESHYDLYR